MKGLILKDVYGCRFQIVCGFAFMLLPMLMLILAGGGESLYNEGDQVEFMNNFKSALFGMVNYMSIVVCSSFYLNTLNYDEASGWTKMQRTMPVSGWQIIGGKFLGVGCAVGVLTLISIVFNFINAMIFDIPMEAMIAMPICFGLTEIVTLLPTIVLGYRFGAKSVTWVYFAIMLLMASGIITLVVLFFYDNNRVNLLRLGAYGVLPVLAVIVIVVCFFTGKRAVTVDI